MQDIINRLELNEIIQLAFKDNCDNALNALQEHYTYGHCMDLAIALHRLYRFEIEAAIVEEGNDVWIGHAWVKTPSGKLLDIMGYYTDRIELSSFGDKVVKGLDEGGLQKFIKNNKGIEDDISKATVVAKCLMKYLSKDNDNTSSLGIIKKGCTKSFSF